MQTMRSDPGWVRFSTGLYSVLLRAYPARFRGEYGALMLQVFRDCALSAARGSPAGLAALWGRTLTDYFVSLVEEHTQRGAGMTRSKWIKVLGWLMAGGGLLMLFAWLAGSRPEYNPYNYAAWPIDRFLNQASGPAYLAGSLFVLLGLVGLHNHYAQRAGSLGRAGLRISLVGSAILLFGMMMGTSEETGPWWEILMLGMTALFAGLAMFGVACLRLKLFPRWNGLPLLSSLPWLAAILVELTVIIARLPYDLPEAVVSVIFLVSFISMALIGYRLQADTETPSTTAIA